LVHVLVKKEEGLREAWELFFNLNPDQCHYFTDVGAIILRSQVDQQLLLGHYLVVFLAVIHDVLQVLGLIFVPLNLDW
jgi:hypothetical protein